MELNSSKALYNLLIYFIEEEQDKEEEDQDKEEEYLKVNAPYSVMLPIR